MRNDPSRTTSNIDKLCRDCWLVSALMVDIPNMALVTNLVAIRQYIALHWLRYR
jgi:hypothetical protein